MKYEAVIGLEIHAELKTKTKMFCGSPNDPDEKHPNINICPVCMGHPGTLPVINREAVRSVVAVGLAIRGATPSFTQFDRKNYFYPDLPKGYQISQYDHPLVSGGVLDIGTKKIRITRVHLEEDTGRLIHESGTKSTLVDFNRAGVPLMELVTEPDFRNGEEVKTFGEELQRIVRYLGASDANMEKGQMRVEVNISLRPEGTEEFGTKVEIKNINSFKFAADAVDFEIKRQSELLERGEAVVQETRGWNEHEHVSFSQRIKESAHDYRYFPEPDLPPLHIAPEFIEEIRATLPELPQEKRIRFSKEYILDAGMAEMLTREKSFADYFEQVVSELAAHEKETNVPVPLRNAAQTVARFLTQDFLRILRSEAAGVNEIKITPENCAELILYLAKDKISNLAGKEVLASMFASGDDPSEIIDRKGLWQMSGKEELEQIARGILNDNPKAVEDFKAGRTASLQFLVGQMMKESRGKANPKVAVEILRRLMLEP